ncbi:alpha/beta hydrolase [Kitasatospora sp. MAA4]|uniref:alpha/beta hydrolase family protein n=1 Tax=Kitasatospora sp. MAA4 TaxID=3035093 RepID=UPI002474910A|nr:alpha/beta hydrolase [Kitasatospora sp. MAA4]
MTRFVDLPDVLAPFVAANLPRATGAGLDPHEYGRVTERLRSLRDWPEAFAAAGRGHRAAGDRALGQGRTVSAGEAYRLAARWFHFATLLPHPDRDGAARAAADADEAMSRALELLDPTAVRIEGEGFVGWLRRPAGIERPPVVLVVPGMDSGKEEFHAVTRALLRRGVAAFTLDGPGQGVLAATSRPTADYHRVVGRVIDALEPRGDVDGGRIAVIGLSLGGYYAAVSAAREPRVRATATVSGPHRLDWDALPPFVTETLAQRCGGPDAAQEFARRVDLAQVAPLIAGPLRVVDGGLDVIPGVVNGEPLARRVPQGEYLLVPHGGHLLGEAVPDWLPGAADWLVERL